MTFCVTACCVYTVFIATTFHDVCNSMFDWNYSVRIYILMVMPSLLLIGQIRHLKMLVPFSGSANTFIGITFAIVLYYIFKEPLDYSDKPLITNWTTWPVFFSTIIFAMEGIGAVMPLENTMAKPQQFLGYPSILMIAMVLVSCLYAVIGFFGYVRFGALTKPSITLNLATDEWPAVTAQILIGLAILFTFGLQFYIPMEILFKRIEQRVAKHRNLSEIAIRSSIIVVMSAFAIAVPDLEPFIAIVGAVFFGSLGIMAPALIETVYLQAYEGFGPLKWRLWKNIFLMFFALIAMFTGSFVSILHIINTYSASDDSPAKQLL